MNSFYHPAASYEATSRTSTGPVEPGPRPLARLQGSRRRQSHREHSSPLGAVGADDSPSVGLDDPLHDGEAETCASLSSAEEKLEKAWDVGRNDAPSFILHAEVPGCIATGEDPCGPRTAPP